MLSYAYTLVLANQTSRVLHEVVCALREAHDVDLLGGRTSKPGLLDVVERRQPEVLLVDADLPEVDRLARVAAVSPQTRIVVVSSCSDDLHVARALRRGVHGYVWRHDPPCDGVRVVENVLLGRPAASTSVSSVPLRRIADAEACYTRLTRREQQVFRLIMAGRSGRNVADHLGISPHAVQRHWTRLLVKLDVSDVDGLVRHAQDAGLVTGRREGRLSSEARPSASFPTSRLCFAQRN